MKRKIISVIVVLSVLFAASPQTISADIICKEQDGYSLRGKCSRSGGEVMLLIVKKDAAEPYQNDDVGYINTAKINKNGEYSVRFAFDKDPEDYRILTKADGQDVTEGIFVLERQKELIVDVDSAQYGRTVRAKVTTASCFSNFRTYMRVAGIYDSGGKLIGAKNLGSGNIDAGDVNSDVYYIDVPQDSHKIKIFTFESLKTMLPYADAAELEVENNSAAELYVAPGGSDSNEGTVDAPLATLEGARKAVRKIEKKENGITVYFRGGRYYMNKPVIFSVADSGTEDCPITYSAYKNEKPEFVGGIYLDGKKAKLANDDRIKSGNVYCIDLAEAGIGEIPEMTPTGQGAAYNANGFELFIDDKAYFPARWPNKDAEEYNTYEKIVSVTEIGDSLNTAAANPQMTVSDDTAERIASWTNTDEAFVGGYPGLPYFDFGFKFTANETTVNLDRKCNGGIKKDGLIYFYNIPEELDSEGEYYIDRANKKLYFYSAEEPSDKNILLTTTNVWHWENGLIAVNGADNINFSGLTVNGCIGFGLSIKKGRNINVSGCTFKNMSESGAYVGEFHSSYKNAYGRLDDDSEYVQRGNLVNNIKFTGCKFLNTGYSGLNVSGGNRKTLEGADVEIYGCEFENFGRIICAYSPGIRMDGVGINVRNCTVHRGDSVGIMSGGNDCIIENNDIFDVARECTDCGVIYLHKGLKNGIIIRNNFIHDITDEHGTNHMLNYNQAAKVHGKIAVYNDGGGSMLTVENNIIKDVPQGFFSVGFGNRVNNNIFIDVKYPIRTRENVIIIDKIMQRDGTYLMPEFNEELGDAAFAELGYLEPDSEKNPVWAVKYPEVFTWKEYLKERGTDAIYPKNDVSDNLITYIKYSDYANQITDIFTDKIVTEKSIMDLSGSDYGNILFEKSVDFTDAENGDFSIAKDSDILNVLPGLRKNHTK